MSGEKVFDSQWIPKWFFICLVKWKFHLNSSIHFDLMSFFLVHRNVETITLVSLGVSALLWCAIKKLLSIVQLSMEWIWNYSFSLNWISLKWSFVRFLFAFLLLRLQSAHDLWEINAMRWYNGSAVKTLFFLVFFRAKFRKLCFHHRSSSSSSEAIVVVALVEIYVHLNCSK